MRTPLQRLSNNLGSMIGVAGTTFSVTIAAVVYASGQYGPRLLGNFMSDRGNQVTLGTFIATFGDATRADFEQRASDELRSLHRPRVRRAGAICRR